MGATITVARCRLASSGETIAQGRVFLTSLPKRRIEGRQINVESIRHHSHSCSSQVEAGNSSIGRSSPHSCCICETGLPTLARTPCRANHQLIGLDGQLNFIAKTELFQPNLGNPHAARVSENQMRLFLRCSCRHPPRPPNFLPCTILVITLYYLSVCNVVKHTDADITVSRRL